MIEDDRVRVELAPSLNTDHIRDVDAAGKEVGTFQLKPGDSLIEQLEEVGFALTLKSVQFEKVIFVWDQAWSLPDGDRGNKKSRNCNQALHQKMS